MNLTKLHAALLILLYTTSVLLGQDAPIQTAPVIDGIFDEWTEEHVVARDLIADVEDAVGIKKVSAVSCNDNLYLYFELDQTINLQGGNPNQPNLQVEILGEGG